MRKKLCAAALAVIVCFQTGVPSFEYDTKAVLAEENDDAGAEATDASSGKEDSGSETPGGDTGGEDSGSETPGGEDSGSETPGGDAGGEDSGSETPGSDSDTETTNGDSGANPGQTSGGSDSYDHYGGEGYHDYSDDGYDAIDYDWTGTNTDTAEQESASTLNDLYRAMEFVHMDTTGTIEAMYITLNGTMISEINSGSKTTKYPGNTIEYNGVTYRNVEIKGRGNSTWNWDKKPYQIKFSEKVDLLGTGAAKKWTLLANYIDATLMRNDVTFYVARKVGLYYTPDGTFVDLYVDGYYIGNYYLTDKVAISKGSVNLENDDAVLVEADHSFESNTEESDLKIKTKTDDMALVLKDCESDNENVQQEALIRFRDQYDEAVTAAGDKDWEKVCSLIEVDSFASYFLITEMSLNTEGFGASCYFYQDGEDDVIHAGPVWDYDVAYGNNPVAWTESFTKDPERTMSHWISDEAISIYRLLMEMPEFRQIVSAQYEDSMREAMISSLCYIDEVAGYLRSSADWNNYLWQRDSFQESISELKNFIRKRIGYMDELYLHNASIEEGSYTIGMGDGFLTQNQNLLSLGTIGSGRQTFQIIDNGDGSFGIVTQDGMALTVEKNKIMKGTAVKFENYENSLAQQWFFLEKDGRYYITAKRSGLVLDMESGTLGTMDRSDTQLFTLNQMDKKTAKSVPATESKACSAESAMEETLLNHLALVEFLKVGQDAESLKENISIWESV